MIFTVLNKEESKSRRASLEVRERFPAIIRIAFVNKFR